MARAFSQSPAQDYGHEPNPGEWQALRGELVALLDQVQDKVARNNRQEPGYSGLSERMRELRYQIDESEPEDRHRAALQSVKRAVGRFTERHEDNYAPQPAAPTNPRDTLQSAIQQIRSRQGEPAAPRSEPHFDELAQAVGGISGRLERLENELRSQARGQTVNIKDIASQVAQLSHVVELLAGAVGETGQVKRLESQIAGLARLITEGQQVDISALSQRLDDVAATMGRLADLQMQMVERVDSPAPSEGLHAIEIGVRNIYDRIDAIEKHAALTPADLEGLTDEMARFTEAMRNPVQPQGLIELIDALNTRIGDLESRDSSVGALKLDVEALRGAVTAAVEPRFAAMEMQIETLSGRLDSRSAEPGLEQLEVQLRQLMTRMDQTGDQLTGLAELYGKAPESQPAPDFETLADMVASRTSDALAQGQSGVAAAALNESGMAEIEARMSRLLEGHAPALDDYGDMQAGIREVNARLARLEASLTERSREAAAEAKVKVPEAATPQAAPSAAPRQRPAPEPRNDAMPTNPAGDAPLTIKPFSDPGPVQVALDAKTAPAKPSPMADRPAVPVEEKAAPTPEPAASEKPGTEGVRQGFDPATAVRPPRPKSSLDGADHDSAPMVAPPEPAAMATDGEAPASANTFIAAARRAAQRQQQQQSAAAKPAPGSGSLIARAFASFQASKAEQQPVSAEAPEQAKPKAAKKRPRKERRSKERKPLQPAAATPAIPVAPVPSSTPLGDMAHDDLPHNDLPHGDLPATEESFLSRHSKPILLGASVVAICFLTLNLINQRLGDSEPTDGPTTDTSAVVPEQQSLLEPVAVAPAAAPRVIARVDSLATASIDPAAARGFSPSSAVPAMPKSFTAAAEKPQTIDTTELTGSLPPLAAKITPLPPELESPVHVEPPPEALGPEALRNAAANGDARAQFEVAAIYSEGRSVPEDMAAAGVWYERAAAQGFAPAQYRLGNLYEHGRGVAKDLVQARLWYQRAADAGNRMSMHNLAALYAGGELGEQKFDIAAEWFERAAERGMKDSQFNLGMLHARGLGVAQDLEASYKWFSIAARHGDADAAKARDDIARSLDAATIKRIDAATADWQATAIDMAANFAPIGTWSEDFDPGAPIADRKVIESVQAALEQLGYDMGTPDGLVGPKTVEAIRRFERATGMSESGEINPRLLAVLGSQPV